MRHLTMAILLATLGVKAIAQDVPPPEGPPPPPPPPAVVYGPADVRLVAEEVGKVRVDAQLGRITFAPATVVGDESLWSADPPMLADSGGEDRDVASLSRKGIKARSVLKDRGLKLPDGGQPAAPQQ